MGENALNYLEKSVVFRSLNAEQKKKISSNVTFKTFLTGAEILKKGQWINSIQIIGHGTAEERDEENVVQQILSEGDEIGLDCLVTQNAFSEFDYISNGCTTMSK
jgi:signal-transduction protein with cAMP-binding, CBS, and nucleotidyltransferase domain